MTKSFIGLCALFFAACVVAEPAPVQKLDEVQRSVSGNVGDVVKNFDISKLTRNPQRDFIALAVGGVVGLATGSVLSCLGILRIDVLGITLIPMTGGLAGLYLANEGYFDGLRSSLISKP